MFGKIRTLELYLCLRGRENEVINDFCHAPTIFKQTYPHFEVLAINDGSTDYSLKRLKEYAAQDARL